MDNINKIISYISPIEVELNQKLNFDLLTMVLKENKGYTVLTQDFFKSLFNEVSESYFLKGPWVEVGVWKGGGALFIRAIMNYLKLENVKLYLYDTYAEVPTKDITKNKDIEFIQNFNLDVKNDSNNQCYLKDVQELFNKFNLNKNVKFVKSDINSLTKTNLPQKISFLFIDVDFYEPTLRSLELFYDKVSIGGIIIIDDYYMELLNCKEAVDAFFKSRSINLDNVSERLSSYAIRIIKQ